MTVIDIVKDTEKRTMTIVTEFAAAVDRVWRLWEDPRQLEKWWGPPTYPSTFVEHDLTPGGRISYFMTGPEGEQHRGWWRVIAVHAPHILEFEDGFADAAGNPNPELPSTVTRVTLTALPGGLTRMTLEATFPTIAAMDELLAMGMEKGLREALGQIDALLAAS